MIGLMYLKELMLIRQMHQRNVIFVIISNFLIRVLNMIHIFEMVVMI